MSQSKNNMPIIIGVVALLAIAGGAAFYFSKNMTKGGDVAQTASNQTAPAAGSQTQSGEAAATPEEEQQVADEAKAGFNGIEVKPGNPVVAKVDGQEISRVDVFRYIKMMPESVRQLPPQAIYPIALEQVVNTRLVQNKAENAGLENDPEVQQQLSMAKQQIIRSVYVQRALDGETSEGDLKNKYNEMVGKAPEIKEVKAAHILVDSEAKAKELITKIEAGEDFSKLAAENSGDPGNKDKGGDLGWFAKTDMVPAFADPVFEMHKGDVSKTPIKTEFGYHVVKVEDTRDRPKPTFEQVKAQIRTELQREKLEKMLAEWKDVAKIEKFDINGDPLKEQPEVAPAAGEASQPAPAPAETPAPEAAQ